VVPSESHSQLEEALERYCAAHPNAADTVDGVRRWWLGDPAIALDDVEAALEALVKRGLLDTRRLPDGSVVYFNRAARDGRS
jgi:phage host-nuclease inhibitor protein Gam